jgi:hypothetical protein
MSRLADGIMTSETIGIKSKRKEDHFSRDEDTSYRTSHFFKETSVSDLFASSLSICYQGFQAND